MAKKPRVDYLSFGFLDAIGFMIGCLAAYWLGKLIGLDVFAPDNKNASLGGIVLVGLGGGMGLQWVRRWQQSRRSRDD